MDRDTARRLVLVMASTWQDGTWNNTAIDVWIDDLTELDEGTAGTTLARLRRNWQPTARQTHPSLQEFMAEYRALNTKAPHVPEPCARCEGSGWITETVDHPMRFDTPKPITTTASRPCSCSNGRQWDGGWKAAQQSA